MYVPDTQLPLAPYLTKAGPLKLQTVFSTAQVVQLGIGVVVKVGTGVAVGSGVEDKI